MPRNGISAGLPSTIRVVRITRRESGTTYSPPIIMLTGGRRGGKLAFMNELRRRSSRRCTRRQENLPMARVQLLHLDVIHSPFPTHDLSFKSELISVRSVALCTHSRPFYHKLFSNSYGPAEDPWSCFDRRLKDCCVHIQIACQA